MNERSCAIFLESHLSIWLCYIYFIAWNPILNHITQLIVFEFIFCKMNGIAKWIVNQSIKCLLYSYQFQDSVTHSFTRSYRWHDHILTSRNVHWICFCCSKMNGHSVNLQSTTQFQSLDTFTHSLCSRSFGDMGIS